MKPSSKIYRLSGALGCLPSLLFFLAMSGAFGTPYSLENVLTFGTASLFTGVLGVIGLISAAVTRSRENKLAAKSTDEASPIDSE